MLELKGDFPKLKSLRLGLLFTLFFLALLFNPVSVSAYSTNMSASVVVGQQNFTSSSANQGGSVAANTLQSPRKSILVNGKWIVADATNNRVLIFNQIPASNNASASIVIGQPDMTSNSQNQGIPTTPAANTLRTPNALASDGTRLFISDSDNHRVLVFNQIPTSNNASADLVLGQSTFTTRANGDGSTMNNPQDIALHGDKIIISDLNNHRVLVWNTLPSVNSQSSTASVVIGQTNLSNKSINQGGSAGANTLRSPVGIAVFPDGKLAVSDSFNNRVLIYNSVPTANNASADVVIGQTDFASATANQGVTASANTLNGPRQVRISGNRMFVSDDTNHRILIYNSIPTINNASADVVLGQSNFTGSSANAGGSVSANAFNFPRGINIIGEQLFVGDISNNRLLIFNNLIKPPGISLNNSPETRENNILRFTGTAAVDSPYILKNVEYSVNGGSLAGATATDGAFDETSENYFFDFNPALNQPKDSNNALIPGFTVKVKSVNNNVDVTDNVAYFTPFDLRTPDEDVAVTTTNPSFEFSVNKQRENLRDSLQKYQVQVRKGGVDSTANWEILVDDIPIDFRSVKGNNENLQRSTYGSQDTNNGVYETDKLSAIYSEESSQIKVYSKTNAMSGTYQWKIVAVDKSGHTQEAGPRSLLVKANLTSAAVNTFPLVILNISGLGNPNLNAAYSTNVKSVYYTSLSNPTFFGIAWTNSKVTLKLTDQSCSLISPGLNCTKTYSTIADANSRFGINVPKGDLSFGKKYLVNISVSLEDKYNELPQFTLSIGGGPTAVLRPAAPVLVPSQIFQETIVPSPIPSPSSIPTTETTETKRCIWFICW